MREHREIKFRLWDNACKRMVYPDTNNGFRLYLNCSISEDSVWCSQDCVLMQYTGLEDKKGKNIYEGDMVYEKDPIVSRGNICEVKFGEFEIEIIDDNNNQSFIISCYGWYLKADDYHCSLSEVAATMVEIIGNIYENPELLKDFN